MARRIFNHRGLKFHTPEEMKTEGRGSGRAKAFAKGVRAAARGVPADQCPYQPKRGSSTYRSAWLRGWEEFHKKANSDTTRRRKAAS